MDPYLSRVYRKKLYTCIEFVREAWEDATGEDLADRLPILKVRSDDRRVTPSDLRGFERLARPENPCIVLMRRPKVPLHMGMFLRRRILHLSEHGPAFQVPAIATLGFKTVCYYR